jgi:GNAT superfamily N-acetyltransferase
VPAVAIREALPTDAGTIVRLIRELAAYENLTGLVRITDADVLRDGFGERRCFECLLAEADGEAVGMAIHRPSYSTFDGRRGLYVEDLFVADSARGRGLGRALIEAVYEKAEAAGASRVYWLTQSSNTQARALYDKVADNLGFIQYRKVF